jgi:hypothetical protein
MKVTVTERMFRDAFIDYNRKDHFSPEGSKLLFDYLESLKEDTGNEIELNVIAICCDYRELTLEQFAAAYSLTISWEFQFGFDGIVNPTEEEIRELLKEAVEDYINENTSLVGFTDNNTVVFQVF